VAAASQWSRLIGGGRWWQRGTSERRCGRDLQVAVQHLWVVAEWDLRVVVAQRCGQRWWQQCHGREMNEIGGTGSKLEMRKESIMPIFVAYICRLTDEYR
jgi:hypothetical protein